MLQAPDRGRVPAAGPKGGQACRALWLKGRLHHGHTRPEALISRRTAPPEFRNALWLRRYGTGGAALPNLPKEGVLTDITGWAPKSHGETVDTAAQRRTRPANGEVCPMFAVDIPGFTDRDEEIQLYLRSALYQMLNAAFTASAIPWDLCEHHDRGDGALIIVPSAIPAHNLISPLPGQLRNQLRTHNWIVREPARMQLRAAIHIGPVYRDDHGIAGQDVNMLCRLLDAQPLRRALADSGAELALIVSDSFYDTVISRHPSLADPALFRPLRTLVKRTRVHARIHVLGDPS